MRWHPIRGRPTQGRSVHEWIGDGWAVLFSHPKDFTPVSRPSSATWPRSAGFESAASRSSASASIRSTTTSLGQGHRGDAGYRAQLPDDRRPELKIASFTTCCRPGPRQRQPAARPDNATVRIVFVIGPDKKVKLVLVYPMSTGRNFDEVLRSIDLMQLTAKHSVATPANWPKGQTSSCSTPSRRTKRGRFAKGVTVIKPYLGPRRPRRLTRFMRTLGLPAASPCRCSARAPGAWARTGQAAATSSVRCDAASTWLTLIDAAEMYAEGGPRRSWARRSGAGGRGVPGQQSLPAQRVGRGHGRRLRAQPAPSRHRSPRPLSAALARRPSAGRTVAAFGRLQRDGKIRHWASAASTPTRWPSWRLSWPVPPAPPIRRSTTSRRGIDGICSLVPRAGDAGHGLQPGRAGSPADRRRARRSCPRARLHTFQIAPPWSWPSRASWRSPRRPAPSMSRRMPARST